MAKRNTPQEVFEAYILAVRELPLEKQTWFQQFSSWDEVPDETKGVFQSIAFKLNCIVGEFDVSEVQREKE